MIFNLLLIVTFISIGLYGYRFYKNQNVHAHLGGAISRPKSFWLTYTIFSWFFLPFFLWFKAEHEGVRFTLVGFLILFWVRGIAELFMLYKFKNWRPPYGMSHDAIVFLFLIVMQFFCLQGQSFMSPGMDGLAMTWIHITTIAILIEIYYAFQFFKLVRGKTMGQDGVWFADPEDPVYKRINLITTMFNWPLYLHLIYVMAKLITEG